jgi:hypothetical protein
MEQFSEMSAEVDLDIGAMEKKVGPGQYAMNNSTSAMEIKQAPTSVA